MKRTDVDYKKAFKMPTVRKITGRTSVMTNAFIAAIIPVIEPKPEEIKRVLDILEMDPLNLECAYCGTPTDSWDHFKPLVLNKKPSGYITSINNLIPSCGKCNMSKRNEYWKDWMRGSAPLSPESRGISDLKKRVRRIEKLEKWANSKRIEVEKIVGSKDMAEYYKHLETITDEMQTAQELANKLREKLKHALIE